MEDYSESRSNIGSKKSGRYSSKQSSKRRVKERKGNDTVDVIEFDPQDILIKPPGSGNTKGSSDEK